MFTSESVKNLAPALLKAQKLMGAALKGSTNPYFKSKYADLGAVLEACKELLNENGVVILQPHGRDAFGTYVETHLLHESGEWISSVTPVIFAKEGDPQAQGSAITYARRYGLQSLLSMPAEDDDGEKAMTRTTKPLKLKGEVFSVTTTPLQSNIEELKTENKVVPQKVEVSAETVKPRTTFRKPKPEEAKTEVLSNGATSEMSNDLGLN